VSVPTTESSTSPAEPRSAPRTESSTPGAQESTWAPLRHRLFRWLWIATVASNVGTWLQNVGASWQMTSLTSSTVLIALVQAATSLPAFLLALPAGALADVIDRRKLLLFTQGWMALAAAGLGIATSTGHATPWLLLFFTFLLGLGAAINGPGWQATTPELVPRRELAAAVTLNSIGFNIARALGPAIGGLVVAAAGPGWTYILNALSFAGVLAVLASWHRPEVEAVLPGERFFGALRAGLRYVRHAPEVLAVMARGSAFILCGSSLWALLPVVARARGHGAAGYGLLLAALGIGAVAGALVLPALKRRFSADLVVAAATLAFAAATVALALIDDFALLAGAMLVAGGAWLSLLSTLNVAIQTVVPSWVRGRAISVYMLVFYGGLAGGSWLWGVVGERFAVRPALLAAAAGMVAGLLATGRLHLRSGEGLNLAPSRQNPAPLVLTEPEPEQGPVLVTVRYHVPPERSEEFTAAMREVRRIRLRGGALQWGLFVDAAVPERHIEVFLVRSWLEHLRQHERTTVTDLAVQERARAFHAGAGEPLVRHLIAKPLGKER
jgi:MFS family permease